MEKFLFRIKYFVREARTIIGLNPMSNMFSLLCIGLIFFMLSMVVAGWWVGNGLVEVIKGEAEISIYHEEDIDREDLSTLVDRIENIDGVKSVHLVGEEEAYKRMSEILGKEAQVLRYFDENPFKPFIEISIHLDEMEAVMNRLTTIENIDHIRDNRGVLSRIRDITAILKMLGYIAVIGVGITSLLIISHIIRQGIYNNIGQVNTLRLLGAPENFIGFPFIVVGLLLTLGGGLMASTLSLFSLRQLYIYIADPLPFLPLPEFKNLSSICIIFTLFLSVLTGLLGSLIGLRSLRHN